MTKCLDDLLHKAQCMWLGGEVLGVLLILGESVVPVVSMARLHHHIIPIHPLGIVYYLRSTLPDRGICQGQ